MSFWSLKGRSSPARRPSARGDETLGIVLGWSIVARDPKAVFAVTQRGMADVQFFGRSSGLATPPQYLGRLVPPHPNPLPRGKGTMDQSPPGYASLPLRSFNRRKSALEAGQPFVLFRIQHLSQITHRLGDVLDRARQGGAAGVGVAAALELLGYSQRLAVSAAHAHDDDTRRSPEERQQHRIPRGLLFQ